MLELKIDRKYGNVIILLWDITKEDYSNVMVKYRLVKNITFFFKKDIYRLIEV